MHVIEENKFTPNETQFAACQLSYIALLISCETIYPKNLAE